jgi:ribosomal protein L37E
MAKIRITARVPGPAAEIACAKCGCPSFERGIESHPTLNNYKLITFECATCGHVETRDRPEIGKHENGRGRAE